MKLLIAIPTGDFVPVQFMRSLLKLTRNIDCEYEVAIESGSLVYMARDKLASKAINKGFTHVLWLDSDMVFEDNILEDLIFAGKDFVSGIAVGRRKPFSSCLYENIDLAHLKRVEEYPKTTFEVQGCGFACVLIKTEILERVMLHFKTAFTPLPNYGEDIAFCLRCQQLGIKIFAEPTVRLGHMGHLEIWPDDCERYRDVYH